MAGKAMMADFAPTSAGKATGGGAKLNPFAGNGFGGSIPTAPAAAAPVAQQPVGGGGGGGGVAPAAAATQAAARPSLDDYIKNNFLYTTAVNEGDRALDDFDAETLRQQQETEADQQIRQGSLQRSLDDSGIANAESFANRGLGRSGLVFQAQDKINEQGVQQSNAIAELLTNLLGQRQQGRQSQEAANRAAINQKIGDLTTQFNSTQAI